MNRVSFIFFTLFLIVSILHGNDNPEEKLLSKYTGIKTFSTDFDRVFTQKITGNKTKDSGKILYMAPDQIRMDTVSEGKLSEQTFIDGEKTTFIYHSKKNVMIKKSVGEAGEYLAFLKGLD
ncbi:MAG TPA: hypothetical protein ENN58_00850, partial [bacterium]|nr:hypothetical protein [bacterium]